VDYVETEEAPAAEPAVEAEYQEVQPEPAPVDVQAAPDPEGQQSFDGLQW